MKKIKNLLLLLIVMIISTGCIKYNANMNIKKDKSMDFEIIYAFNSALVGDEEILKSEDKQKMIDQGFDVTDYVDDTMKGFKLVKTIKNIDEVSTTDDTSYSLSGIVNESEVDYIFEVKKGFLKNTYTAKLNFNASDSGVSEDMAGDLTGDDDSSYYPSEDEIQGEVGEDDTTIDGDLDTNTDMDLSQLQGMLGTMDLSFNVTLPYKAISSNATSTDNNNKKLSWKLTTDEVSTIEFKFDLYNMNNIMYIGIGIIGLIIVVVVVVMFKKKKDGGAVTADQTQTPSQTQPNQPQPSDNSSATPLANPVPPTEPVSPVNPTPSQESTTPSLSQMPPVAPSAPSTFEPTPNINKVGIENLDEPEPPIAKVEFQGGLSEPVNPVPPTTQPQPVSPINPVPNPQPPVGPSVTPMPNPSPTPSFEVPIINHTSLGTEPTIANTTQGENVNVQTPSPVIPNPVPTNVNDDSQSNNNQV